MSRFKRILGGTRAGDAIAARRGCRKIGETRFFPTRYTLKRNNEETHLLMAAMEPADAEMHDTGLQLAPIARHRWRAGHGAAHVGNFVCVRRARARQCYEADTNETFPDCRTRCKTRQPQKFSRAFRKPRDESSLRSIDGLILESHLTAPPVSPLSRRLDENSISRTGKAGFGPSHIAKTLEGHPH